MADIGTLNPEQMLQQQQILRQQKMAEMLMQQGMQQPQGQMVSGRYVAPSIFQNLAGLANVYMGQKGIEKAEKAQLDMAKAIRQGDISATADFMSTRQGKPAEMYPAQAGPMPDGGNIPLQESKAAIAPNPQAAYANLAVDPRASARLQNIGLNKMFADPEGFTLAEGATRVERQPDGSLKVVASGGDKTSPEYKNYLLATKDPINPYKGSFVDYQTMLKKAGASSVNLPNEGERKAGFMSNILDRNILQMQTALKIDPTAVKPNVPASIVEALTGPNLLSRSMKPAQRQIVEDSQLDVLDAALTLRTGAAYTREQLNAMRDTYFPTLLDKPQAIREKKQRLESLLEGAYIMAGRAVPTRVSSPPPIEPATPTAREQLNIPKVNAPAMNSPRFLGFEPAPTGQR
jgi:hypothetical protein